MENYNNDLNKNLQNIQEIQTAIVENVNGQNTNNEEEINTSSSNNNNINTITFSSDNDNNNNNNNNNTVTSNNAGNDNDESEMPFNVTKSVIGKFIYGDKFVEKAESIGSIKELDSEFNLLNVKINTVLLKIKNIFLKDRARYRHRFYLGPIRLREDDNGTDKVLNIKASFNRIKDLKDAYLIRCREFEKINSKVKSRFSYVNYCLFKQSLVNKLNEEYSELKYLLEQINILNDDMIELSSLHLGRALGNVCKTLDRIEKIYNEDDLNQVTKKNL